MLYFILIGNVKEEERWFAGLMLLANILLNSSLESGRLLPIIIQVGSARLGTMTQIMLGITKRKPMTSRPVLTRPAHVCMAVIVILAGAILLN